MNLCIFIKILVLIFTHEMLLFYLKKSYMCIQWYRITIIWKAKDQECNYFKRWQRLIKSSMSFTCHSVTPRIQQKGEKSPHRQIYLIQRRAKVACGVAQRCKCWEVGLGMAATCWVRQYRVFTNATSPSRLGDSRGWLHFYRSAREPLNEIVIIELEIINPWKLW